VVFGKARGFSSNLNLSALNGANGFAIGGDVWFDYSGNSVSSGGDINGDGFDDVIVGAKAADANGSIPARVTSCSARRAGFRPISTCLP